LKTKRSVSGKCPQEGRRKTELLQQRDQAREDIAFRESWEDQMPSLQRMILKAAAERAGKPAARVQGYWPAGRLRKRELETECCSKFFAKPRPDRTECVYEAYSRGSGSVLEWTLLAAWRVSDAAALHATALPGADSSRG